jgi:hypothetical protein
MYIAVDDCKEMHIRILHGQDFLDCESYRKNVKKERIFLFFVNSFGSVCTLEIKSANVGNAFIMCIIQVKRSSKI